MEFNIINLEDYCYKITDGTHDSPKATDLGKKLVTSKNITGGKLNFKNTYNISLNDFNEVNKRSKVNKNDVLISMIGTVGEVAYIDKEPDFAIKNVGLFKNKSEIEGKWLFYYLQSPMGQNEIKSKIAGTTQSYISLGNLKKIKIVIPTIKENMNKVVKILSKIDSKIEVNNKINQNLYLNFRYIYFSRHQFWK